MCGLARQAEAGVDHQRHAGQSRPQQAQAVDVVEPAAGADRRAPRHQQLAARRQQAFGHHEVLGCVGEDLEALRGQLAGRFDEAEDFGLERVVVGDDLEFDPRRAENFARHQRGGDRFLGGVAAGRIGQHGDAEIADHFQEPLAGAAARLFAAQRHRHDASARGPHALGHYGGRGIERGADHHARGQRRAVEHQRIVGEVGVARRVGVHVAGCVA